MTNASPPPGLTPPEVVTEVLGQKLPNVRCAPTTFYKSLAFHAFDGRASMCRSRPACTRFADRFVRWESGQQTEWIRLTGGVGN